MRSTTSAVLQLDLRHAGSAARRQQQLLLLQQPGAPHLLLLACLAEL
jgi:hypothetical protein